ncbi:MAG: hypothetical protein ABW157_06590 [Candidatus Thiodiazotropha sp. LLP2]
MKRLALLAVVALVAWGSGGNTLVPIAEAKGKACLACHEGVERFNSCSSFIRFDRLFGSTGYSVRPVLQFDWFYSLCYPQRQSVVV